MRDPGLLLALVALLAVLGGLRRPAVPAARTGSAMLVETMRVQANLADACDLRVAPAPWGLLDERLGAPGLAVWASPEGLVVDMVDGLLFAGDWRDPPLAIGGGLWWLTGEALVPAPATDAAHIVPRAALPLGARFGLQAVTAGGLSTAFHVEAR